MKKKYIIITIVFIILIIGIVFLCRNSNKEQFITENQAKQEELKKLKELFEKYAVVKVYLKDEATTEDIKKLSEQIKEMPYFKSANIVTSSDAYQKFTEQLEKNSEIYNYINEYSFQNSIWVECYYLDDIILLDEDGYFEKIKTDINKIDDNKIINYIVTAGIINIYNEGGMDAVNEYVYKMK